MSRIGLDLLFLTIAGCAGGALWWAGYEYGRYTMNQHWLDYIARHRERRQ